MAVNVQRPQNQFNQAPLFASLFSARKWRRRTTNAAASSAGGGSDEVGGGCDSQTIPMHVPRISIDDPNAKAQRQALLSVHDSIGKLIRIPVLLIPFIRIWCVPGRKTSSA
jgi:hypothetical protein